MPYLGDFAEDATVYIPFNTFSSNDPQASVTITNLVDADIAVHKDGGLTQIATDGATIAIDYDGITGNHLITIDTSVHADYAIGSDYMVRIEGTTVDAGTINAWIGSFSIENRFNEVAVVSWNGVALGTTNPLPNAAADAAGGLAISDVGGLDLDAMNTAAVRLTAVRAAVLTDWINGQRLDLLLDAIPTTPMRGTDNALLSADIALTGGAVDAVTDVTNQVAANMTAISGDAVAADNLEAQYDTTGLVGDTFPSNQSQLSGLANVGSAVHIPAESYTLTTGVQSANTFSATEALDGIRHEHTDTAGVMDLYYEYNIGSGVPSSCQVSGYVTGNNDDLDVYGYDWATTAWVQIGNIQGSNSTANSVNSFDMFINMVGVGVNAGVVRVRLFKASGLSSALLAIDQIFVSFNQGAASSLDSVYYDSNASNTGTTNNDGVPGNPVSTEAAMNTLLADRNLNSVRVAIGSSLTFTTAHNNQSFIGDDWVLALGGQDVSGCHFNGAVVSGTGTGTSEFNFHDCELGTCTLDPFHASRCGFNGTVTFGKAGDYLVHDSYSNIAGSTTPIFDTGSAILNVNLAMPNWSNGIEIQNLNSAGTDLFSISGKGQIIYAANSSGAVEQRGDWKVTNTGGVTITSDDNTTNVSSILADTNELQTDDIPGTLATLATAAAQTSMQTDITAILLDTGTTLDDKLDAIKLVTDKFVFTVANQVDTNTKSINDAEVIGNGNSIPWDGA